MLELLLLRASRNIVFGEELISNQHPRNSSIPRFQTTVDVDDDSYFDDGVNSNNDDDNNNNDDDNNDNNNDDYVNNCLSIC